MRTLWQVANTAWSDLTQDEQSELIGAALGCEAIARLGYDPAEDGPEVDILRPGAEDGPEVATINVIMQNHWQWELDEERARV